MTDTPDPISETVNEVHAPVANPPPKAKRASPVLPVLGGVVAAVIGFGVAQVVPNGWPLQDTTALQTTLSAQADRIAGLEAALAGLGQPVPDAALEARVAALETEPDLADRIDALEAKIAAAPVAAGNADLSQLRAEIEALKSGTLPATATAALDAKLAEATASIAAIKADAEAIAAAAAQRSAVRQIQAALDSGAPFGSAVADLGSVDLPAVLADNAQSGLPTVQALRASFPDAARAALDAALQANMGESWAERVGTFLRGQTGARSLTPREGNDPDAVLSRAEAALGAGDLPATLAELDLLPPEALAAMVDWRAKADLRVQAAAAVQGLLAALEE